jgi:MTH538 TIR-like domain (DUF1863).
MARNITKSELESFTRNFTLNEQRQILKAARNQSVSVSTFLSHSSKDVDILPGVVNILKNHGAAVYIDEVDPNMPPYTSHETARLLKSRINESKRFVLLTSENSKDSRWVPWELGIADGYKNINRIALFPSSENMYADRWSSWEYLGLYLKIVWGKLQGYDKDVWMVLDEESNTATELSNWLAGG